MNQPVKNAITKPVIIASTLVAAIESSRISGRAESIVKEWNNQPIEPQIAQIEAEASDFDGGRGKTEVRRQKTEVQEYRSTGVQEFRSQNREPGTEIQRITGGESLATLSGVWTFSYDRGAVWSLAIL
jgi:hypothetical protein